ncbi:17118_t:CDS:2 [Entrophospora sp. SA101]|nr:17117_t:CDS:2 [Entrophospora sp. SA101]CAJ0761707.1 17118_t:CDS:2 [Entrophospora sp. SA101]
MWSLRFIQFPFDVPILDIKYSIYVDKYDIVHNIKKLTSNRQSVLLKQTLDNPNKPQPVMLETGFKPLMLPIMVDNESQSNEIGSGGHSDRSSKRNSMFDNGGSKRYSLLNIAKKRLSG